MVEVWSFYFPKAGYTAQNGDKILIFLNCTATSILSKYQVILCYALLCKILYCAILLRDIAE
jgi:hypothetical protein